MKRNIIYVGLDVDDTQYHGSAFDENKRYEKPVQALTCYKGIKNIFALTMITEIGDIKRFAHLSVAN